MSGEENTTEKQMWFLHENVSSGKNWKQSKFYISAHFKLVEIKA